MHELYHIVNLPGTLVAITAVVSLIAVYLYEKQKHDRLKEAAGVILAELERAEDRIPQAKKVLATTKKFAANAERVQIITTNNWQNFQHLLSRSLPDDVTRSISEFYTNCSLLDELLSYIYSAFRDNVTGVRVNTFRIGADYLKERIDSEKPNPSGDAKVTAENAEVAADINRKWAQFNKDFATSTSYYPIKPGEDAQNYLDLIRDNLSQTRVGDKLRRIQLGFWGWRINKKDR
jgi:hypothetical protein